MAKPIFIRVRKIVRVTAVAVAAIWLIVITSIVAFTYRHAHFAAVEYWDYNDVTMRGRLVLVEVEHARMSVEVGSHGYYGVLNEDGQLGWLVESGASPHAIRDMPATGHFLFDRLGLNWARTYKSGVNVIRLLLPCWLPAAPSIVVLAIAVRRAWRVRLWKRSGRCLGCGYDLRGSTARCPECGRLADKTALPP